MTALVIAAAIGICACGGFAWIYGNDVEEVEQ